MQCDDHARSDALFAQSLDCGMGRGSRVARTLQASRPADVVQLSGTVNGYADVNLVLFEHANVVVGDEGPVRLNPVLPVLLKAPGPQCLEILLGNQQRLSAEQDEPAIARRNRGPHLFEVVGVEEVAGVPLRILVAILTLDVTRHPQRPKFYAHRNVPSTGVRQC